MISKKLIRLFTVDEFYRMAEIGIFTEDDRVELIEGEIIQMTPISISHASHSMRFNRNFIYRFLDKAIVSIQNPVRLSQLSETLTDIALLKLRGNYYSDRHPMPEDVYLLVEIADSSYEYDRQVKAPLYAKHGVPELWILNLDKQVIEIFRQPSPEGYRQSFIASPGESINLESFPEYTFNVSDILG
ncbi:MAG: Uma2 family endonuclease, partial [Candidatus Omnitrophota bacterium]